LATRVKGFTVNIIPHDATRSRKQFKFTGRKLVLFRFLMGMFVFVLLGSILILSFGTSEFMKTGELRAENALLADSLSTAKERNRRLDAIETELQGIRDTRVIIDNLATAGVSPEDHE
jgi:Tfp pilus assembly protein PilN